MPLVQKSVPEATLTLCGRGAGNAVRSLASHSVRITGTLPEGFSLFDQHAAYAMRLQHGAGSSLKVLEPLAAGLPLVARAFGVRGYQLNDSEYLPADDAASFAQALIKILKERERLDSMAERGRKPAQRYSWDALGRPFGKAKRSARRWYTYKSRWASSHRRFCSASRACARAPASHCSRRCTKRAGLRAATLQLRAGAVRLRGAQLIVHEPDPSVPFAHVILHGIPDLPRRPRAEARRELGIEENALVMAHFGFIHPDKGIEEVLRVVAQLRATQIPHLQYRICGKTFATPALARTWLICKRLCARSG